MKRVNGSAFKIESGVPLPRQSANCIYPFKQMKVGDSFVTTSRKSVYNSAAFHGMKVSIRKQTDGSFRVWRIK